MWNITQHFSCEDNMTYFHATIVGGCTLFDIIIDDRSLKRFCYKYGKYKAIHIYSVQEDRNYEDSKFLLFFFLKLKSL